jgi:hypothetical protein
MRLSLSVLEKYQHRITGCRVAVVAPSTKHRHGAVYRIIDRMPVILSRYDYVRSLGEESDPRDLMRPFRLG